jgi:hypothetical protein
MKRWLFTLALGLWLSGSASAAEPWLLAFPQISTDPQHAIFSGEYWSAIYFPEMGKPSIVPRDSLIAPALPMPAKTVRVGTTVYRIVTGGLSATRADSSVDYYHLPDFEPDVLSFLAGINHGRADTTSLVETVGPLTTPRGWIYFGLTLRDTLTGVTLGGIGWFNPATSQMGRLYSQSLVGLQPTWMLPRADTLLCVFENSGSDTLVETHLIRHPLGTTSFDEVNWRRNGIPGTRILNAVPWGDTLLLATDNAIVMWKPQHAPAVWQTRAWAASEPRWLYLKTVADGSADSTAATRFLLLRANLAVEVEAQAGDWLQVVAPFTLDGYVSAGDWDAHGKLWTQPRWHCNETPCFARLRIPTKNELQDTDVTNTPLLYLNRDSKRGVKVRFRALWIHSEDLTPALLAPQ